MNLLKAVAYFDRILDRYAMAGGAAVPCESELEFRAEALTAALELSGCGEQARSEQEIREALDHFRTLVRGGVIDRQAWLERTMEIAAKVLAVGAAATSSDQIYRHDWN